MANNPHPAALESERFCLGAILIDDAKFPIVGQALDEVDFYDAKHRMIFAAMKDLQARGEPIDRVTLAGALDQRGELAKITLDFLTNLDTGIPASGYNLASYVRTVAEKSRLRKIILHSRDLYNAATAPDAVSSDVIAKGQSGLTEIENTMESSGQMLSQYIDQYPGGINVLLDPSKFDDGIRTGFIRLDEWTSGIHPKEIFVVGARPGVGKTGLGLNIISFIAKRGGFCVFFSLEMSKRSCLNRLICAEGRVDVNRFRSGYLNPLDRQNLQAAASRVSSWPIYIDDTSGLKVADISMRLQSLSREKPVALCMIDYFQLLRSPKGRRYGTENEMFTEIAHDLQLLTKSTSIPLLLLSQLNRDSEKATGDKRPKLSQCRGAGAIEEIANVGLCIYRPELVLRDREDLRGVALALVDKNREGPTGEIKLVYLAPFTTFTNQAGDLPEEDYKSNAAGDS